MNAFTTMRSAVLCAGLAALSATTLPAQNLFGIDWDSGDLYRVDAANGVSTLIGPTGISAAGSLEFAADGTLYSVSTCGGATLYRINPSTGAATAIGSLGIGTVFEGALTFAPDGTAYATNQNSAAAANLFRIDLTTGAATLVGAISGGSHDINGLAWRSDGRLVALDRVTNALLAIDPTTANSSLITVLGPTVGSVGGMTSFGDSGYFNTAGSSGSNSLYACDLFSGSSTLIGSLAPAIGGTGMSGLAGRAPRTRGLFGIDWDTGVLYRVDPATAALTAVGPTGVSTIGSLEFAADGSLYGFTSGPAGSATLYRIDPVTAAATAIGPLGPGDVYEGALAFAPDGSAYATNQYFAGTTGILFRVNLATGAATLIGRISGIDRDINGLAWRSDGQLVGLDRVTNSLLAIDPATAASSVIAAVPPTIGGIGGMTVLGDVAYFNTSGPGGSIPGTNELWSCDLFSGAAVRIGSFAPTISGAGISGLAGYCVRVFGGFIPYGTGCRGGNGLAPNHAGFAAGGTPERGELVRYTVSNAAPNQAAALFLGFSNTSWMGVPLPLSLGFIGADPSCNILAEGFLVAPFATDAAGVGAKLIQTSFGVPLGTRIYTQTVNVDFGVSSPLKIVVSNGLETRLGGDDCN